MEEVESEHCAVLAVLRKGRLREVDQTEVSMLDILSFSNKKRLCWLGVMFESVIANAEHNQLFSCGIACVYGAFVISCWR